MTHIILWIVIGLAYFSFMVLISRCVKLGGAKKVAPPIAGHRSTDAKTALETTSSRLGRIRTA